MKPLRYVIIDVFTDQALQGNPLCVFTDARGLDAARMQALARELNLSETTFVLPAERGGHARVRIFTPTRELPFAGHPTLGTAFVLAGPLESREIRLELDAGVVPVSLEREGPRVTFGWMTQPVPQAIPAPPRGPVLAALGLSEALAFEAYDNGPRHLCIALPAEQPVRELRPDLSALARATELGVGVFHAAGQRCRVRYFAPAAGIAEDPATGSFAGPLALHLVQQGLLPPGQPLRIEQGSEVGRPSQLYARATPGAEPLVEVGGAARIVARGQFVI